MEKVFDHTNHKKLWEWLAENPGKEKVDWPEWEFNRGKIEEVKTHCFSCEYAGFFQLSRYGFVDCNNCSLNWPLNSCGRKVCDGNGGLWCQWEYSKGDKKQRSSLALQIANIPVKEGVITK